MRYWLSTAAAMVATSCLVLAQAPAPAPASKPAPAGDLQIKYKWVFDMTPLGNDAVLAKTIELMKRAKKAGYNGIFAQDARMSNIPSLDEAYARNVRKFRQACTDEGMTYIAAVCPMGYASELLAADPNLAEGMPVRGATFVVKDGKLVPGDEVSLENGSLSEWKGNTPVSWTVDKPDTISFKDDKVTFQGRPTLRQEHVADQGVIRLIQKIKVEPWHYYHISVMTKTEDCTSKDFRVFALEGDPNTGRVLTWEPPDIKKTMDWTKFDACFDSLDNSEVAIYIGSYGPKSGKVWYSDVKIEPAGFVNLLRRDSLPLTVTSADGKTTYVEGKDFAKIADPKLGNDPKPGRFTYWHDQPTVAIPAGSGLKDGQKVLVSYHFTMPAGKSHQTNCCFSEPKVYELLAQQAKWVKENANPDVYMMSTDEIRLMGWDDTCTKRKMTCGQILAENMAKCSEIYQKNDPGKMFMVWSDMFSPFHNAKTGEGHYLNKDSCYGSWEGLPTGVVMMNWQNNKAETVKFFSDRGNKQVLAGYYDQNPARIKDWLTMALDANGVVGVMYTTWLHDHTKIEEWIGHVNEFEAAHKAKN